MCDVRAVVGNGIWRSESLHHGHTFDVLVAIAGCSIAKCDRRFRCFEYPTSLSVE